MEQNWYEDEKAMAKWEALSYEDKEVFDRALNRRVAYEQFTSDKCDRKAFRNHLKHSWLLQGPKGIQDILMKQRRYEYSSSIAKIATDQRATSLLLRKRYSRCR